MTDIWTVVTRDRHIDFDVELFSSMQRAVDRTREIASDLAIRPEDVQPDEQLTQGAIDDGWILHITYSIEGDCVIALKRPINDET
jgi:hypothetical protein